MGNFEDIGAAIKAELDTIADFNIVYNYEPKELLKYPAGTVTAGSHSDEFASTSANQRTYTYFIRLYYRTDTAEDAEGTLRRLADDVIVAIENNVTLSGTCDFARPISSSWNYQEREVPVRMVEITINCVKRDAR